MTTPDSMSLGIAVLVAWADGTTYTTLRECGCGVEAARVEQAQTRCQAREMAATRGRVACAGLGGEPLA